MPTAGGRWDDAWSENIKKDEQKKKVIYCLMA